LGRSPPWHLALPTRIHHGPATKITAARFMQQPGDNNHHGSHHGDLDTASARIGSPDGSAQLLDPDQVARGIAEGAVANPVRLLGRFLDTSAPLACTRSKVPWRSLAGPRNNGVQRC
jgi:hypothetical protein